MLRARTALLLLAALGSGVAACSNSTTPLVCTDAGCLSGLALLLPEPLPDGSVVSLQLESAPWTVTCGVDVTCSERLFFGDLRAEQLVVRVTTPTGAADFDLRPEYRVVKPNGPDCPPDCFYAEITLPSFTPTE